MLLELAILLASGLMVFIAGQVVYKIINCRLALIEFKKKSKGIPMCPDGSLLGNHIVSVILRPNICDFIVEVHGKLGKYIGLLIGDRQFCISTLDLDLVKTIILDESDQHFDRLQPGLPLDEYENSMMLAPEAEWRPVRRVVAPALKSNKFKAPNVIREIEDCIGKLVAHIDRKLIENNNQACQFNVNDFSHRYSLNLVFSCFYKQYNEIDFDDPDCEWTRMLDYTLEGLRSSKLVKLSMIFPKICGLIDWLMWNFHKESMYRRRILEFVKMQTKLGIEAREQLEERKRDGRLDEKIDTSNFMLKDGTNFRRNLIDHVVDQFLDGKITKRQYFNNSCFVVAAADKTSSDCIMHTIYMLSIHQDIQDKLRQSVKTNGAESEYLDWVLRESLRLFPPANIGCSRTTRRDIPLKNGYVVPAGTLVVTCAFVIHRLKEYWGEDAEEFRPERWQDTSKHHPLQFLTFGAGTRGCPGREFAMFELKMLFAALVSRYKFEGKRQDHIYQFDAPLLIFALPHEPTIVTIGRLEEQEC